MATDEIVHADGRVELSSHDEIEGSALFNHDLAPVRVEGRKWNTWDFAALWVSMALSQWLLATVATTLLIITAPAVEPPAPQ